jgi:hypothetical protein
MPSSPDNLASAAHALGITEVENQLTVDPSVFTPV